MARGIRHSLAIGSLCVLTAAGCSSQQGGDHQRADQGAAATALSPASRSATCPGSTSAPAAETTVRQVEYFYPYPMLSLGSAQDVATYADGLATLEAVAEQPKTYAGDDSEMVYRSVTYRVHTVHWARPGAPQAPVTFSNENDAYSRQDPKVEMHNSGTIWTRVGQCYLSPVVQIDGKWIALLDSGLHISDEGSLDVGSEANIDNAISRQFAGTSVDAYVAAVRSATPDPAADPKLPPIERKNAVEKTS